MVVTVNNQNNTRWSLTLQNSPILEATIHTFQMGIQDSKRIWSWRIQTRPSVRIWAQFCEVRVHSPSAHFLKSIHIINSYSLFAWLVAVISDAFSDLLPHLLLGLICFAKPEAGWWADATEAEVVPEYWRPPDFLTVLQRQNFKFSNVLFVFAEGQLSAWKKRVSRGRLQ